MFRLKKSNSHLALELFDRVFHSIHHGSYRFQVRLRLRSMQRFGRVDRVLLLDRRSWKDFGRN